MYLRVWIGVVEPAKVLGSLSRGAALLLTQTLTVNTESSGTEKGNTAHGQMCPIAPWGGSLRRVGRVYAAQKRGTRKAAVGTAPGPSQQPILKSGSWGRGWDPKAWLPAGPVDVVQVSRLAHHPGLHNKHTAFMPLTQTLGKGGVFCHLLGIQSRL